LKYIPLLAVEPTQIGVSFFWVVFGIEARFLAEYFDRPGELVVVDSAS